MKRKVYLNLSAFQFIVYFFLYAFISSAQNIYELDLSNSSNYSVDCGTVTPAKWSVTDNYCSLTTSEFSFPGDLAVDPLMVSSVTISLKSTGNVDCSEIFPDGAFLWYSVNNGSWRKQSNITSCKFTSKTAHTVTFKLHAAAGSSIKLRVSIVVDSNTEKIWVEDGDITVGIPVVADDNSWVKRLANPQLVDQDGQLLSGLSIYPNPMKPGGKLNMRVEQPEIIQNHQKVSLKIYNALGNEVYSLLMETADPALELSVNLHPDIESGIYILVVSIREDLFSQRLVVR